MTVVEESPMNDEEQTSSLFSGICLGSGYSRKESDDLLPEEAFDDDWVVWGAEI